MIRIRRAVMTTTVLLLLACLQLVASAEEREITIGVLANNGREAALEQWRQHADYLADRLPNHRFKIVPLDFDALYPTVRKGLVDFVIVNTGQYVELEADAGIKRIATLSNRGPAGNYTVFGGVLITRNTRTDLATLADLRGKKLLVPDTTSFGGWLMQQRELKAAGIEQSELVLESTGSHEGVVRALLEGKADAGAVRTGVLERMGEEGTLDLSAIRVINELQAPDFPFRHSTRLYPEWSFSKLRHTGEQLSRQVAIALLSLPEQSAAAESASIGGWTIAADYAAAHELYRELKLGPYRGAGRFNLADVLHKYRLLALLALLIICLLVLATVLVVRANRRLTHTLQELELQRKTTDWALDNLNEQTVQLEQTNEELQTINEQLLTTNNERGLLLEALRSSEDQLRAILDSTAEAIYGTNLQGICTFCNAACLRMLGYDNPAQLIGKNMHHQIHHSHRDGSTFPEEECRISQSFKEGQGIHVDDEVFWRRDGSCFPVEYWSYPQYQDGRIVGTVATFMDITERIKSHSSLLMLSRAVENSPAIVVITDHAGSIEYVNSKFVEITGFTAEDALGHNPRILNAGVQSKEFYQQMWDTINAGQEWRGEFCNRKKNGEMHWEHASISPIRDDHGRITHFVAVKEDITESRRIADELRRAKEEAEAGNRSKSEFLANMSHEIRTPLNAIIGFNTLALETQLTTQQHDYLSRVNFAATSLLRIINEILDFSKIEAGKLEFEHAVFSPREVLQNIINLFQQQAAHKGLSLELHCSDNLPAELVGDSVRLGQVLVNLVGNAVKFTEQGTVSLYASPTEYGCENVTIEFSVRDTGIGLAPDKLTKLFQPFTQADGSITRKFGGTGLGLSISKRIVELTGGHIWAESESGHGSVFSFNMPFSFPAAGSAVARQCSVTQQSAELPALLPYQAPPQRQTARPGVADELAGLRILLVEDNEMNRTLAVELLRRRGAQIDSAVNGCEALARILHEAAPYDIVLMDLQMPGMDGYEATRKIRSDLRFSALPIIAVTAHAMVEERDRCREVGMNGYLTKPLNVPEMINLIRETTNRGSQSANPAPATCETDCSPDIPGLDVTGALERIDDDLPLYLWLLRTFVEKHGRAAAEIATAYARGNTVAAKRRAHTVRGAAGAIGADLLLEQAGELEELLGSEAGGENTLEQIAAFDSTLRALTQQLRLFLKLPDADGDTPAATERELEQAHEVISRLGEYLRNQDGHAVRYLQDSCSALTAVSAPELNRLQHLLASYDYDTALEQLLAISLRLGISTDQQGHHQQGGAC